jgi:hypothetical protein
MPIAFPQFIGVRLTRTELAILRAMAAREQTTLSGMVRECIVRESVRPLLDPQGEAQADASAGRHE